MINLNRQQRRLLKKRNSKRSTHLTIVPKEEWPIHDQNKLFRVWVNRDFLVQEFQEYGSLRISVNRTQLSSTGRWVDKIGWNDLQKIKRAIGYGECYAIEVYPPDRDIIDDANMRHIWVLPRPLKIGWKSISS